VLLVDELARSYYGRPTTASTRLLWSHPHRHGPALTFEQLINVRDELPVRKLSDQRRKPDNGSCSFELARGEALLPQARRVLPYSRVLTDTELLLSVGGVCDDVAVEIRTSAAIDWLLRSDEPAIRLLVRRDILGEPPDADASRISSGPMVTALLSGQHDDGGFGRDPYRKWTGVHWRLISLAELGVPPSDPRAAAAAERVLTWITRGLRHPPEVIDGLVRAHGSVQGNALGACCRLGLAGDPRAQHLAESLISWQWPDGGWNCDREATGYRSSFHETIGAAWGLHEYGHATGAPAARDAADRAAELFLEHRLFRRLRTGEIIDSVWLKPRYPPYWHYDILQALLVLTRMGRVRDPRAADALDELEHRRLQDGRWQAEGQWWKPADSSITPDVVGWGRSGEPNPMITLNALRVLRAAGRLAIR